MACWNLSAWLGSITMACSYRLMVAARCWMAWVSHCLEHFMVFSLAELLVFLRQCWQYHNLSPLNGSIMKPMEWSPTSCLRARARKVLRELVNLARVAPLKRGSQNRLREALGWH